MQFVLLYIHKAKAPLSKVFHNIQFIHITQICIFEEWHDFSIQWNFFYDATNHKVVLEYLCCSISQYQVLNSRLHSDICSDDHLQRTSRWIILKEKKKVQYKRKIHFNLSQNNNSWLHKGILPLKMCYSKDVHGH